MKPATKPMGQVKRNIHDASRPMSAFSASSLVFSVKVQSSREKYAQTKRQLLEEIKFLGLQIVRPQRIQTDITRSLIS
jgi:hypothetical protein